MTTPAAQQEKRLEEIAAQVKTCVRCRLSGSRTHAVPGEGPSTASIMFVGEGPGFNEDQQGRPFVGRAGKLLDDLLASVPLNRSDVFITNVVKCRPPENRDPAADEMDACSIYLNGQIEIIQPRVIATLGRHSLSRFFPDARISKDHGRILTWRNIVVYPLYHPAAALRSSNVMAILKKDIAGLSQALVASLRMSQLGDSPSLCGTGRPATKPVAAKPEPAQRNPEQLNMF